MNDVANSLGDIRQTFRPKKANIVAGTIIGVALVLGGICFAVFIGRFDDRRPLDTGDRVSKYALVGVFGAVAPAGGIALLLWMKRLAGHRVTIFEQGLSYHYRGVAEDCLWKDVAEINEIFTAEQLKVLKVPGASIHNIDRSLLVRRQDGKEFVFTVNSIDSIPQLAKLLEEARDRFGIEWKRIDQ